MVNGIGMFYILDHYKVFWTIFKTHQKLLDGIDICYNETCLLIYFFYYVKSIIFLYF